MFPYREVFLAVIISLASFTLANVQPDYQHQSDSNPRYSQPVPQYQINSLTEQYRTGQLPNQESPWYLPRVQNVQTVYPSYESDQDKTSNLIVHHRYRRSLESDPTTIESSKSAIVAHDNDVVASSLIDVKHPTANDLLPEHEPTDINDKRVENRQTKNNHVTMPRLFDLYPENIYSGYSEYRPENAKIMQQPLPSNPNMPSFKSSEAIKTIVPTARQKYCCNDDEDPRLLTNGPYVRWEQPLEKESPDTDDDFDNDNRNNDEDPRLLTNRPSVRWESYLQSSDTDDDYNTDNKYRAASYRQGDSEIFYTMLLHNAVRGLPNSYNQNFVPMWKKNQQQAVQRELEKTLQEIINGMGTLNTAKQKQLLDLVTMYVPRNVQLSSKVERPSSSKPIITTGSCPVLGGSCGQGTPIEPRYRNNEKLSGINENVDTSYSDRTGISLPFHFPHYPDNYPTYDHSKAISDWDEFSNNAEFYNRNSNSAHRSNPSKIRIIPNYNDKYYTNININNDPNNLAPKIPQTRSQSLDTYNYSPENIQAVSSDLKYDDNTYPSDTQSYDMFSSSVYY